MPQDNDAHPQEPGTAGAKTLDAAWQDGQQALAQAFGSAPVAMFAISLTGGRPATYLAVNDAYCGLTGYSRHELAGAGFLGDLHPDDQPDIEALIGQIGSGQSARLHADARLIRNDGAIVYVRLTGSATRPAAGEPHLAVCAEDLTAAREAQAEIHRLERELQRIRRLASLGQLTEGITHDFNNIITVITNFASLVRDEISVAEATDSASRWAPVRWDMEQIEDAADRAKRLIKELQAFSLREQSEPAAVDVGQLINDIALLLREVLGEHIPIVTDPGRGLWEVETDRALIEQAVINIALNARDAMPGGGRLTIAARNVDTMNPTAAPSQQGSTHLADLPPSRYVQLCITDTGSGMEAPTAARAFEPFFTTKPADAAAGLGLATVGRIAAQAGGTAWLHSEPGAGTTVSIVLPAALASTPAAPHAAGQPGQVQAPAESVLVVDDDPAVRTAAHRVLSTAGYHVTTAADGPQALALLADPATAPDLILTDVVMPGLTGPAFAARAQALRPGTRVLYMSGYERLGIPTDDWPDPDQLIAKPFSRAALLARVSHALMAGAAAAASGATRPAS